MALDAMFSCLMDWLVSGLLDDGGDEGTGRLVEGMRLRNGAMGMGSDTTGISWEGTGSGGGGGPVAIGCSCCGCC